MWRDTVWGQQAQLSQKPRGSPKGQPRRYLRGGLRKQTRNALRGQIRRAAALAKAARPVEANPLSEHEAGVRDIMEQRVEAWLTAKLAQRRRIA
jgi:hypothetical protein